MLRTIAAIPLLGAAIFLTAADAGAQRRVIVPHRQIVDTGLAGTYENISSGGTCYIYRSGRGWTFVNEHGASAYFVEAWPGQLDMVSGEWDPTTVTVGRHRNGQLLLRFDSGTRPGYWLKVGW